ncbi:hypothetical protein [Actinophytocola sp. NPDC049390]|uniref:hypothetical protein n=1 Tax=Actinophytocola sp. NPDC049390 TaxID=3363894 RepID=UPI0037A4A0DB
MNDLEDRLRTGLGELADTVPPSPHARADLDRRLAGGPRRRVPLIAAAAAVVVAAVAVPVAVSGGGPGSAPVATGPTTAEPGSSTGYLVGPVELGRFGDHSAVLYVREKGRGEEMCIAEQGPEGPPVPRMCEQVPPTWPAPMGFVLDYSVLGGDVPDSGPLPHLMLFVVAPQVHELEVRAALGEPVPLDLVAEVRGARFLLADFGGSKQGFGYTAKDANGTVLVTAIS